MANYAINNVITLGSRTDPLYRYTPRQLVLNGTTGVFSADVIGNELAIDTFSFTVRYNQDAPTAYRDVDGKVYRDVNGKIYLTRGDKVSARDYLRDVAYGTPCWWDVGTRRIAKGYVSSIERVGKYAWKVTCMSGIGLLADKIHTGGVYDGATFSSVFNSIVGSSFVTTRNVDPSGAAIWASRVYGWLPYDSARANLHRLLFAMGAALIPIKVARSQYDYSLQYLSMTPTTVPDGRVALGGSVTMRTPATGAEVTEHAFSPLDTDAVTLFDNTTGDAEAASNLTVIFPDPIQTATLATTGTLAINERGVNYAVVSGKGTLTGKPYTHSRSLVTAGDTSGDTQNVKRVTDNCLISTANSINVANRVLAYYQGARTVKAKLMLKNERPGDNLQLTDAWGDELTAYLARMELSITSILAASVELVEGYVPEWNGNNFTHLQLMTASGSWTVPDGVNIIRTVLFQGGAGGQGGCAGHDGWGGSPSEGDPADGQLARVYDQADPPYYPVPSDHTIVEVRSFVYGADRQRGEPGGAAGAPGANGRIMVVTAAVQPGDVLTYSVGSGGIGGAKRANGATGGGLGTEGGHTTVTCYRGGAAIWSATSADGAQSEVGYRDVIGGNVYGLPGEAGHDGGSGGTSDANSTQFANTGAGGNKGGDVGEWHGANGGKGISVDGGWGFVGVTPDTASGGGGGGAAWGARGTVGGKAHYTKTAITADEPEFTIYSGKGGDGATALPPSKPTYGQGGGGGNGGGSGGNVGGTTVFVWSGHEQNAAQDFLGLRLNGYVPINIYGGGKAGDGSKGGDGGDGAGLIYY